jgi:Uma2 family endonuclease
MSTILELPEVRQRVSPLTVEEYHRLGEFNEHGRRTELIRGSESDFTSAHPTTAELVVEVAVSSPALDRENASLYAEAGVKEYWIVLGTERRVEVHRRPENGRYQGMRVFEFKDTIECSSVPALRLTVSELFA